MMMIRGMMIDDKKIEKLKKIEKIESRNLPW
jgi:hypothetical protein